MPVYYFEKRVVIYFFTASVMVIQELHKKNINVDSLIDEFLEEHYLQQVTPKS
jgi:hypothetical protein